MRPSQKLTIAGIIFLVLTFVFAFFNGLAAFISFVLFLLALVGAWVATVPERGGVMAWLHRRKEENEAHEARRQKMFDIEAEAYHDEKGRQYAKRRWG